MTPAESHESLESLSDIVCEEERLLYSVL